MSVEQSMNKPVLATVVGDTYQRPARRKNNQGQVENPYETLRDPPRRPFVINKAFDPEVCNNGGQSSVYDEARDSARNSSIYAELEEMAVTEPGEKEEVCWLVP